MTCYAIGHLREIRMGPEIETYLRRIDATLAPFQGRFRVHGGRKHLKEGRFPGDLVVIAFPDLARAEAWYASPAYAEILPLRLANAQGEVFLIEDCGEDHKAADLLP